MIIVYRCAHCCNTYDSPEACLLHEDEECHENIKLKSCWTCIHQQDLMSGTGRIHYYCDLNIIAPPVEYKKHCESWGKS